MRANEGGGTRRRSRQEAGYKTGVPAIVALVDYGGAADNSYRPNAQGERPWSVQSPSVARKSVRSQTSRSLWYENFAAQAVIAIENARLSERTPRENSEEVDQNLTNNSNGASPTK